MFVKDMLDKLEAEMKRGTLRHAAARGFSGRRRRRAEGAPGRGGRVRQRRFSAGRRPHRSSEGREGERRLLPARQHIAAVGPGGHQREHRGRGEPAARSDAAAAVGCDAANPQGDRGAEEPARGRDTQRVRPADVRAASAPSAGRGCATASTAGQWGTSTSAGSRKHGCSCG